jgi:hypothetical protein
MGHGLTCNGQFDISRLMGQVVGADIVGDRLTRLATSLRVVRRARLRHEVHGTNHMRANHLAGTA